MRPVGYGFPRTCLVGNSVNREATGQPATPTRHHHLVTHMFKHPVWRVHHDQRKEVNAMRRLILMLTAALIMVLAMALTAGSAMADTYNITCTDCVDIIFIGNPTFNFNYF